MPSVQPRLASDWGQMLVTTSEGSGIEFFCVLCFYKHIGFCTSCPCPTAQVGMLQPPVIQSYCPWFNFVLFSLPTPTPTLWDLGRINRAVWNSFMPRKLVFAALSPCQNTELLITVLRTQPVLLLLGKFCEGRMVALLLNEMSSGKLGRCFHVMHIFLQRKCRPCFCSSIFRMQLWVTRSNL